MAGIGIGISPLVYNGQLQKTMRAWRAYSDTTLAVTPLSSTSMGLGWTSPVIQGATLSEVLVYRGTDGVNFSLVETLGVVTSWADTTCSNGTLYYYYLVFVTSRSVRTAIGTAVSARTIEYVDYIQSSGTQFIDSGIIPTNDTGIKGKSYMISTGGYPTPGGTVNYDGTSILKCFYLPKISTKTGDNILTYTHNNSFIYATRVEGPNILEFEQNYNNSNNIIVNGISKTITKNAAIYTHTLWLFRVNGDPASPFGNVFYTGRIYFIEITNQQTLINNYKPCLNLSGQFCMYDEVSKTYKTNAGTGIFTGGGVTSARIDILLNRYAADGVASVTIDFRGADNGVRSTASDSAVTTLMAAGCTILTNP